MISINEPAMGKAWSKPAPRPRSWLADMDKPVLTVGPADRPFIEVIRYAGGIGCVVAPRRLTDRQREVALDMVRGGRLSTGAVKRWHCWAVWVARDWIVPEDQPAGERLYFGC